jgi:hypothetical protein
MTIRRLGLAVLCLAAPVQARAACDLDTLVGYQIVWIKTVYGYQDGSPTIHKGFDGCEPDRRIVFNDQTTLRCVGSGGRHTDATKAYLFARSNLDIKMCVGDDLFEMSPLR